jgi:hypothetical protein
MSDVREVFDSLTLKSAGWMTFGFVGPVRPVLGWCSNCRDVMYSAAEFECHVCSTGAKP